MTDDDKARAERARQRASWPIERVALQGDDDVDLSATTTAAQRLDMMWRLAVDAWVTSGQPWPEYRRDQAPGRVVRRGDGSTRG